MTDNDIIKALETCTDPNVNCSDCPFHKTMYYFCRTNSQSMALMLINRQKAEIERLRKEKYPYIGDVIKDTRAEAIKEFAERLKASKKQYEGTLAGWTFTMTELDNLVKEMVGESNGNDMQ